MPATYSTKQYRFGRCLAICFGLLLLMLQIVTISWAEGEDAVFYDTAKHGWFWYEETPAKNEPEPTSQKPQENTGMRQVPSLAVYTIDNLWNMHPDDFQQLLTDLQKKAVQYPSEHNILEYLSIQDVARRKALAYTHAASYVTQKYPNLFSMNQVYPTTGPGVTTRIQMQQEAIAVTIGQAKDEHALLFFISPDCRYCSTQRQILSYFEEKYDWQVKPINIDKNAEAAARFNITVTPTLLLIERGKADYLPVATGVISLSELERKLYQAIRYLRGETDGDNFMLYEFQKGSSLDPTSILHTGKQPWLQSPRE